MVHESQDIHQNPSIIKQLSSDLNQPLRILHVDDSEGVLTLQRLYLQRHREIGFEYIGVIDSDSAFETIAQWKPDLILSDISRPDMDGFTFTEILKAQPETQAIPIAILSANSSRYSQKRALSAGATAFFTKPSMPHMDKIHRLAVAHRVDKVLDRIPFHHQNNVIQVILRHAPIDDVTYTELHSRLHR